MKIIYQNYSKTIGTFAKSHKNFERIYILERGSKWVFFAKNLQNISNPVTFSLLKSWNNREAFE